MDNVKSGMTQALIKQIKTSQINYRFFFTIEKQISINLKLICNRLITMYPF